jgi:replicative DNA helicase Mcm
MVIDVNLPPDNPEENFGEFFKFYEDKPNHFKYREKIQNASGQAENVIYILFEDVLLFDPPLAALLRDEPDVALHYAAESFKDLLRLYSGGQLDESREYFVRVTTKNKSNEIKLRGLRAVLIDKLISVHAILIRASQIIPQITIATFQCPLCQTQIELEQIESRQLIPPKICPNPSCKNKGGFTVISKESKFIDWQSIKLQELPEELSPGRIPYSIQAILTHDLVDKVRPGDRVQITGIFKSYPNDNRRGKPITLFTPFIKVLSVEGRSTQENDLDISPEEMEDITRYSQLPKIQQIIANSIAPGILGREHLKMAAAMALFGGLRKVFKDGSSRRGSIHVLFVGDPGTGKSQILKQCKIVAPQAIYTSGKGSSAAGLTAAVVRESDIGGLSLEAGALVLADGGNAMIDEFDKMDKKDRVAIHEAMEQQSYHYNTEILTTSGERIKIGRYVDDLMEKQIDQKIQGVNCEILPFSNLELYSTDFTSIFKTKIDRISRHQAPSMFYKLKFTNGRSITVTPEHPIFVFRGNKPECIQAENCKLGEFIPVPKFLPNSSEPINLTRDLGIQDHRTKSIVFPKKITPSVANILGLLTTKGHSYNSRTFEIGFTNTDKNLIEEFQSLMIRSFNINPTINRRENGLITASFHSFELFKWMISNFPELMVKPRQKRIPSKILGASKDIASHFLQSAFKADGRVESTNICYNTSSKGLSADYQDLLLKLGIHSRIEIDTHNDSNKVYIKGQSLILFFETFLNSEDGKFQKLHDLIYLEKNNSQQHNIFPISNTKTEKQIKLLNSLKNTDVLWERIENIEIIENTGKKYTPWVYDITVEPNHTFISQGVILHNTISIAKAGIIATLRAQTSIIAAANPKMGRYSDFKTPTENINLSPPLLSRFDLIFIVKDAPDEDFDKEMADFILGLHSDDTGEESASGKKNPLIPVPLLKKYILYAKTHIKPELTPEAKMVIKDFYLQLRKQNTDDINAAIAVVARNLEGYIRLAEAYAKMALNPFVSKEMAESALKLAKRSLDDISLDPITGKLDADRILTGAPSQKSPIYIFLDELKKKIDANNGQPVNEEDFLTDLEFNIKDVSREKLDRLLKMLINEGSIYRPSNNNLFIAKTRKA